MNVFLCFTVELITLSSSLKFVKWMTFFICYFKSRRITRVNFIKAFSANMREIWRIPDILTNVWCTILIHKNSLIHLDVCPYIYLERATTERQNLYNTFLYLTQNIQEGKMKNQKIWFKCNHIYKFQTLHLNTWSSMQVKMHECLQVRWSSMIKNRILIIVYS